MKKRFKIFLIGIIIFSFSSSALAWNARGHMIVASITYRNLSDSIKQYYVDILKKHPFFDQWNIEYENIEDIEFGEFLFMKASTWPDDIRQSGNPNDHPIWHYITYKIDFENGNDRAVQNDDENILTAIDECIDNLKDENTPKSTRSIYLCWLIHLVGDIHQPLHCASLFSQIYPNGDKGGNGVFLKLKVENNAVKLHSYWDGLLGSSENYRTLRNQVTLLQTTYKKSSFSELTNTLPEQWSFESFDLAVSKAYCNGEIAHLNGIQSKETAPLIPNVEAYKKASTETAEKRVVLAGYRLANLLN